MVQKIDKTVDSKKSIATPSDATTSNQSQLLNKQSSKTSKGSTYKADPSGLPKYR